MKRPIAISLSPNTSKDDVYLAWRLLFLHMYWKDKRILSRAAEKLAQIFPGHFVSLASSGRQALYDLLRSYGIARGDEVILQAFTCIAVPEPIVWTGATPIYADIKNDSYSFDVEDVRKKITSKTKAIIIQHTFGIPGPIEAIVTLAKEHDIFVIEDCALALGVQHNGNMLGTFGDAAILSFGRDKCVSSIYGGAVISKDMHLIKKLQGMQLARSLPPKTWVLQQMFHVVLFSFVLPLYFWYDIGKAILVLAQKLQLISRAYSPEERLGKRPDHIAYSYSPALGLLLLKQLEKLDRMNARRREITARYDSELRTSPSLSFVRRGDTPLLRYPVQVDNPKGVLLDAKAHNMLLGDWYDAPLVPGTANMANFQYEKGSCPNAEETAKHIINLPTYASLTDTQVTSIIAFMNHYGNTGN